MKPESKPPPSPSSSSFMCDIFCISFAGVTILVSQTVLSLLIRRVITKTSEAIPLLGSKLNSKTKPYQKIKTKKKHNKTKALIYSVIHSHIFFRFIYKGEKRPEQSFF